MPRFLPKYADIYIEISVPHGSSASELYKSKALSLSMLSSRLTAARLLKRNHNNFVSIHVGGELVLRVHRPVAKRFSQVWKSALQDPNTAIVHVTFPSEPPAAPPAAPPVAQPGPSTGSTQETAEETPPPTVLVANNLALRFVVQWMEEGGADPSGNNAVPYPQTRQGLQRLLALAEALEIRELGARLRIDLERLHARRPRRCPTCHNAE